MKNKIGIKISAQVMSEGYGGYGIHYDVKFFTKRNGKTVPLYLYNYNECELMHEYEQEFEDIDFQNEFSEYKYGVYSLIQDREKFKSFSKEAYKILCKWNKNFEKGDDMEDKYEEFNKFYEDFNDDLSIDTYIMEDLRSAGVEENFFEMMFDDFKLDNEELESGVNENYSWFGWYNFPSGRIYYSFCDDAMRYWNEAV